MGLDVPRRLRWPLALLLLGCDEPLEPCAKGDGPPAENVLILVADDVGIDKTSGYGEHESAPPTPNIDALAREGLLFRNAYATPTCSPTRAALLTGRLPSRTGVGRWIQPGEQRYDLELDELTLPEMLRRSPSCYSSAWIGKWHVVSFHRELPSQHPLLQGFDRHAGSLANLGNAFQDETEPLGHFLWEKSRNGQLSWSETYSAIDTTDEALAFVEEAVEPWLLVVSYNLAHVPWEAPPDALNPGGVDPASPDLERYEAMVMAMDAEIGRLLDGIPRAVRARTNIVYLSDNGTDADVIEPPWARARAKGTVYDGGVRVPFIVAGPRVATPGAETEALVHVVDLFPTIAEIAGVDLDDLSVPADGGGERPLVQDGQSFLSVLERPEEPGPRERLYTEGFFPNGHGERDWHLRMLRDADWKLIRTEEHGLLTSESFYRYEPGALDEGWDLLAQKELDDEQYVAWRTLSAELDTITAELDDAR